MSNTGNVEKSAITSGAHHIGLTVPNIKISSDFFINQLGFVQVGEKPDYPAVFITDGTIMLTLWQALDSSNTNKFDRKNTIGLHHLALRVKNAAALEELYLQLLEVADVEIEFSPEQLGSSSTIHMMTIIPGGIRLEFIATE